MLFTCTPQKTATDVHVLCWTGDIADDGTSVIPGVGGRQFEVKGEFVVDDTPFGFDDTNSGNGSNDGDDDNNGIEEILPDLPEYVDVYGLSGVKLKGRVRSAEALDSLPGGIYIINGFKVKK